ASRASNNITLFQSAWRRPSSIYRCWISSRTRVFNSIDVDALRGFRVSAGRGGAGLVAGGGRLRSAGRARRRQGRAAQPHDRFRPPARRALEEREVRPEGREVPLRVAPPPLLGGATDPGQRQAAAAGTSTSRRPDPASVRLRPPGLEGSGDRGPGGADRRAGILPAAGK